MIDYNVYKTRQEVERNFSKRDERRVMRSYYDPEYGNLKIILPGEPNEQYSLEQVRHTEPLSDEKRKELASKFLVGEIERRVNVDGSSLAFAKKIYK